MIVLEVWGALWQSLEALVWGRWGLTGGSAHWPCAVSTYLVGAAHAVSRLLRRLKGFDNKIVKGLFELFLPKGTAVTNPWQISLPLPAPCLRAPPSSGV